MKSSQSKHRRPVPQASVVPSTRFNPRRTVLERLTEPTSPDAAPPRPSTMPVTPVDDPFHGRTFRLDMVNAAEDIPRVVRCYAKHKGMECALVLRPHDGQGVLVHVEGGQAWKWAGLDSDIPQRPSEPLPLSAAPALAKGAQKELPSQGPITLRSQWSGKLSCDNGNPRISLQRKVASYGTLYVWSDAVKRVWRWQVERAEKWFTQSGNQDGTATSLVQAIRDGLANAMGLLGEACSVRDSRRRAALDPVYGEAHPIKPAHEGKDPTDKFNPKEPKVPRTSAQGRKAASPPASPAVQPDATSAPRPSRRRVNSASTAMSVPPPAPVADAGEIDPAKDKLLVDAFSNALDKVMQQL